MSCLRPSPPNCVLPVNCGNCSSACPDFTIKQHDTVPSFKVSVEDDAGPLDLNNLVLEASMWVCAKLKTAIGNTDTTIQLANNIGFEQALVNDIIIFDRARSPEHMRIIGFDEIAMTIEVERGYNGTCPSAWKKGAGLQIFRIFSAPAATEMIYDDETQVDGCVNSNQLSESLLIYEWNANDTCVSGCFWFEFKLIKMLQCPVVIPSYTPMCYSGLGVEWVRRFPSCNAFLIKICETLSAEI